MGLDWESIAKSLLGQLKEERHENEILREILFTMLPQIDGEEN